MTQPDNLTASEKRKARKQQQAQESTDRAARQDAAIQALVSGATKTDAAAAAGVARETLYQWMAERDFQHRLSDSRAFVWQEYQDRLRAIASKAAATVADLLESDDEKTRLHAALAVLKALPPPNHSYTAHHDIGSAYRST